MRAGNMVWTSVFSLLNINKRMDFKIFFFSKWPQLQMGMIKKNNKAKHQLSGWLPLNSGKRDYSNNTLTRTSYFEWFKVWNNTLLSSTFTISTSFVLANTFSKQIQKLKWIQPRESQPQNLFSLLIWFRWHSSSIFCSWSVILNCRIPEGFF